MRPVLAGVMMAALLGASGVACRLAGTYNCEDGSDCAPGFGCAEDDVCHRVCDDSGECEGGEVCVGSLCRATATSASSTSGAAPDGGASLSTSSPSSSSSSTSADSGGASSTASSSSGSSAASAASSAVTSGTSSSTASSTGGDAGAPGSPPDVAPFRVKVPMDDTVEVSLTVTDPDGDLRQVNVTEQPAHGVAAVLGDVAGGFTLRYAATGSFVGPDAFRLMATDATGLRVDVDVPVLVYSNRSCAMLLNSAGEQTPGVYVLDVDGPEGSAPFSAYCDMTSDGGGWTLALKVDGEELTFGYNSQLWTAGTTHQPQAADRDHQEALLASFHDIPAAQIRLETEVLPDRVHPGVLVSPLAWPGAASSLAVALAGGQLVATSAGRAAWEALVPDPRLQANCNREGVNNAPNPTNGLVQRVRIGFLADNDPCGSPDSVIGVGVNAPQCSGSMPGGPISAGNMQCALGYARTPLFAWLFVREDDFTDLAPTSSCEEHLLLGHVVEGWYLVDEGNGAQPQHCP
ncbi:MAG: fibrinogen-like YCDxxxxGGGW domain-containing protein [Myxococcota bacterium]